MTTLPPEVNQILLTIAVLLVTVTFPLIPTLSIYKLIPGEKVWISGPFQGLTFKATGAFAAYFVTFTAATPFAWRTFNVATSMISPTWTIHGRLTAVDRDGDEIGDASLYETLQVSLQPQNFSGSGGSLWIKIPEIDRRIPSIALTLPTFGSKTISLDADADPDLMIERDEGTRTITIRSPIVIRQARARAPYQGGEPLVPSVSAVLPPPAGSSPTP